MKIFKEECTEDYLDFSRKFEVQKRAGKFITSDNLYIITPLSLCEILDDKREYVRQFLHQSTEKLFPLIQKLSDLECHFLSL